MFFMIAIAHVAQGCITKGLTLREVKTLAFSLMYVFISVG